MRKNSIKNTRINGEVQRELSRIISREIKDPRIAPMTSVVDAVVTSDLKQCKAYISVLGNDEEKEETEEEKNVDALVCQTDDYTFGLFVLTPSDTYDKAAEKEATELIKSIDFVYAERVDMAMTDYFQVLTPERWKYLCHYETTETENGGYKLTYYNEDVPVLTLEARYYDGEDQPLDSVWQGYLGRIETVDGKKYDLLSTISQYSRDASDEWKEMYDTYLDVINGIRIMDGCSLTEGSHA